MPLSPKEKTAHLGCWTISGRDICVRSGGRELLSGVQLDIHCGQTIGLIGPNGSGKSTLLKVLLGAIPYTGALTYQHIDHPPVVGYVPQTLTFDRLVPLTVLDLFAISLGRTPAFLRIPAPVKATATRYLELVGAAHLLRHRVGRLSGGELQRVLLALALSGAPQCLLLDEPASALDARGLENFYQLVDDLRRDKHMAVVLVSHDVAHIADHVDRLVLLQSGKVIASGDAAQVIAGQPFRQLFGDASARPSAARQA